MTFPALTTKMRKTQRPTLSRRPAALPHRQSPPAPATTRRQLLRLRREQQQLQRKLNLQLVQEGPHQPLKMLTIWLTLSSVKFPNKLLRRSKSFTAMTLTILDRKPRSNKRKTCWRSPMTMIGIQLERQVRNRSR